jgi:outer membrane lipoprotein SlyB
MKIKYAAAALAVMASGQLVLADAAMAHKSKRSHHHYHGKVYYEKQRCKGGNGAVGTVAGGVGGAVIGSAVVGGPVATIAGGVGGALLGRHLDKKNTRKRQGCK